MTPSSPRSTTKPVVDNVFLRASSSARSAGIPSVLSGDEEAGSFEGIVDEAFNHAFKGNAGGTAGLGKITDGGETRERIDFGDIQPAFIADDKVRAGIIAKAEQSMGRERQHLQPRGEILVNFCRHDVRAATGFVFCII